MNPLNWNVTTQIVSLGGLVMAVTAIWAGGQALADWVPYATKEFVVAQVAVPGAVANATQLDLLEFQITTFNNALTTMRRQLRAMPDPRSVDYIDLEENIVTTQKVVDKKQKAYDLLKCLVQQRNPCIS